MNPNNNKNIPQNPNYNNQIKPNNPNMAQQSISNQNQSQYPSLSQINAVNPNQTQNPNIPQPNISNQNPPQNSNIPQQNIVNPNIQPRPIAVSAVPNGPYIHPVGVPLAYPGYPSPYYPGAPMYPYPYVARPPVSNTVVVLPPGYKQDFTAGYSPYGNIAEDLNNLF